MLAAAVTVLLFCGLQEVNQKVQLKDKDASISQKGQGDKAGVASLPLPPYDPNVPIGQFPVPAISCW